jgi:hypothetical protein
MRSTLVAEASYDDAISETRRFEIARVRAAKEARLSDDDVSNENHRIAVSSRLGILIESTAATAPAPPRLKREFSPRAPPSSRYFVPRCENREEREERERKWGGQREKARREEKVGKKREERRVKRPARKNEPRARETEREREREREKEQRRVCNELPRRRFTVSLRPRHGVGNRISG